LRTLARSSVLASVPTLAAVPTEDGVAPGGALATYGETVEAVIGNVTDADRLAIGAHEQTEVTGDAIASDVTALGEQVETVILLGLADGAGTAD
jgi:hypothetical protein